MSSSMKGNNRMSAAMERTGQWIFSQDIPTDVVVAVGEAHFPLHKFMLVAKSNYIRKLIMESTEADLTRIDLTDIPGGAEIFEKAAKFCYGVNFEITVHNVAALRCAAEYLQMTDNYSDNNLVGRTEDFLSQVALSSLSGAIVVLKSSHHLLPMAEDLYIVHRCVDVISSKACNEANFPSRSPPNWWTEELTIIDIQFFAKIITAMKSRGAKASTLSAALITYAERSLRDLLRDHSGTAPIDDSDTSRTKQRELLESIVCLLPPDKAAFPINFLCCLLRSAIYLKTSMGCKNEVEKRISMVLEHLSVDDLLAMSFTYDGERLVELESIRRIILGFVEREKSVAVFNAGDLKEVCSVSLQRVGKTVDAYLGEIATYTQLTISKFNGIANTIPKFARKVDDDLYRAIDIYLKAHPNLDEIEREKVCSVMEPLKLSYEARVHASQNKRLPVQIVLHALYYDQLKLRSGTAEERSAHDAAMTRNQAQADVSLVKENEALRCELMKMKLYISDMHKNSQGTSSMKAPPSRTKPTFFSTVTKTLGKLNPFRHGSKDTSNIVDAVDITKPRRRRLVCLLGMAMAATSLSNLPSALFHGNLQRNEFGSVGMRRQPNKYLKSNLRAPVVRCQSTEVDGPKTKRNLLDNASNLLTNLLSGGNLGSMPIAEGAVSDLFGRPLFFALYDWFLEHGSVYKLAFGPKAFVVVSDPIVARYILRENAFGYDKGVLADILEPIMGKGLIPADLDTWKQRRRVIAPGFHALYLEAMTKVFTDCSERSILKLEKLLGEGELQEDKTVELDMEAEFSSLALDIIGLGVFNYDFGSVTKESPVIKAVYGTLFEAEHRSTFYIPYWKVPLARWIVPRQRKFHSDLKVINDCLDGLIRNARETREEADVEKLQQRDYLNLKDASLLRFLVDMRGVDVDDRQLRDDLMTMLIAGHETTAAVLTWAVFLLAQNPSKMKKAQAEIDLVLGKGRPTFELLKGLKYIRLIVAETLRLFPQPPLLIRRALKPDTLPGGYNGDKNGYAIPAGTDIFISVYNLHRSPYFWENPQEFEPERFQVKKASEGIEGWDGFDPSRSPGALYPNEIVSDFSFLPFGGGPRKCVGDQFALMESTIALAMLLQKFDVELRGSPESVELVTGATIHTKGGLWCKHVKLPVSSSSMS